MCCEFVCVFAIFIFVVLCDLICLLCVVMVFGDSSGYVCLHVAQPCFGVVICSLD